MRFVDVVYGRPQSYRNIEHFIIQRGVRALSYAQICVQSCLNLWSMKMVVHLTQLRNRYRRITNNQTIGPDDANSPVAKSPQLIRHRIHIMKIIVDAMQRNSEGRCIGRMG